MGQGTILWIGLLVVLAVLFVVTVRRMSRLIRRTRDLERFQRGVEGVGARLSATTRPFVADLDVLRRHAGNSAQAIEDLPATRQALVQLGADWQVLRVPRGMESLAAAMRDELARAVRAMELVEHGLDALSDTRGGRELEAQTSIKRGALNLRHAADAFERLMGQARGVRPADLAGQGTIPVQQLAASYGAWSADDADGA